MKKYYEYFFDPRYDGFEPELEFIADMPFHTSKEVESSPLGVGFEVLDHRTGYIFEKALSFARNTGVKWARLQTGWQRAEKEPGKYDFVWLDEIVVQAGMLGSLGCGAGGSLGFKLAAKPLSLGPLFWMLSFLYSPTFTSIHDDYWKNHSSD